MKRRPAIKPRKTPVQARSSQLVRDILRAAVRVLEREGAARFTTIRVAQAAGVSVGSLYQYFPNKQAILYRLQLEEWEATGNVLESILGDRGRSPKARLRETVRAFFRSECAEAPLRLALNDTAPVFRDAPEAQAQRERGRRIVHAFVAEAAPRASHRQRRWATDLLLATVSALGREVSERQPSAREVDAWADAVSQMLLSYLARLR